MPRFYCPDPLAAGSLMTLPAGAARHVQVLRLQPGAPITLFDGRGGEYEAVVEQMGRSDVAVRVGAHATLEREAVREVHLAVGMPANERMDWLVEKATELGVASIQPLECERSVLRLSAERARKKQLHWQGIAIAACEQCGRNRVPTVHEPMALDAWLRASPQAASRVVLSLASDADGGPSWARADAGSLLALSGPEGGLTAQEEAAARACGFRATSLGPRALRAETAPLALLAAAILGAA